MDKLQKRSNCGLEYYDPEDMASKINELVEFADGLQKLAERQQIIKFCDGGNMMAKHPGCQE